MGRLSSKQAPRPCPSYGFSSDVETCRIWELKRISGKIEKSVAYKVDFKGRLLLRNKNNFLVLENVFSQVICHRIKTRRIQEGRSLTLVKTLAVTSELLVELLKKYRCLAVTH